MAASADCPTGSIYRRDMLVSSGAWRLCTRLRTDYGLHHHDLVLYHSYLLLRRSVEGPRTAAGEESDHGAGSRVPRGVLRQPASAVWAAVEAVAAGGGGGGAGACVVL